MNILVDGQTLESPELNRGIGIYFKNVLNNMCKISYEHRWFITVSKKESLAALDSWVAERIKPVIDPVFLPSPDYSKTKQYTKKLQNIIKKNCIDVVWFPNPLMVNVLFPNDELGCLSLITIYDLIPAVLPIKEWSRNIKDEYLRRLNFFSKMQMAHAICISHATEQDAHKYIGGTLNLYTIFAAVNSHLFYHQRQLGGINKHPVIVFTGGFDYRKNIEGAVGALSQALKCYPDDKLLQASHMYIVCNYQPEQKYNFELLLNKLGLTEKVELTGFIPDEALSQLYATCDVFFFPSLYEGFGLPILEAMLGGAYILSANNSSLPEVCGGHALLCDASDIQDMAQKLREALHACADESLEDKRMRQEYALQFSWEKTAQQTLEVIEKAVPVPALKNRLKIAVVTPWPEQKTGIANYVYQLMPYWTQYFDVDVFVKKTNCKLIENKYGKIYSLSELRGRKSQYDHILYELGNNSDFHKEIYELFQEIPGIAEIHDFILNPFFYHAYFLKGNQKEYQKALEIGYGEEGKHHFIQVYSGMMQPDHQKFPMCHTIVNQAYASIVHNHWSHDHMVGGGVNIIPLACLDNQTTTQKKQRPFLKALEKKVHKTADEKLIGAFGFINKNKRPNTIIRAMKILLSRSIQVRFAFFGELNDPDLKEYIRSEGLEDKVVITGYLNREEYETALELCDIVVNLRYPSMGESSATLSEALKFGKPLIVSAVNQYLEYPDEVCWKVDMGFQEVEQLSAMLELLLKNDQVRFSLGQNARSYADTALAPNKIAQQYYELFCRLKEQGEE